MNVGKNIRHVRKSNGIKQKDLAKAVGISNSFLCDIEAGRTLPSLTTLSKISKELKTDISDLFKQLHVSCYNCWTRQLFFYRKSPKPCTG